jgi:uncharacterized protein (DUF1778 family)
MPVTPSEYIVRLHLPESLLGAYEKEAERSQRSLEDFLLQHLRKTRALLAQDKPLIVTDADRRRIEVALAKGFNDGSQLADSCERLSTLNISGIEVRLSEQCMARLGTRVYGTTLAAFVQETVTRLLETEVGLR